jgi:hypothetical protein
VFSNGVVCRCGRDIDEWEQKDDMNPLQEMF